MRPVSFASTFLLSSCGVFGPPDPPSPVGWSCVSACKNLADYGCPEGKPSPRKQVPCKDVCEAVESSVGMTFHAECLSSATTLDAIRSCGAVCKGGAAR